MKKFTELVTDFRANVRDGIPSTLTFTGKKVRLTAERKDGRTGVCDHLTKVWGQRESEGER